MTTDAQDRTIGRLVAEPTYSRADVRPLADGSCELWAYGLDGVLVRIHTVYVGGNHSSRPAWRATQDRRIGAGPFE